MERQELTDYLKIVKDLETSKQSQEQAEPIFVQKKSDFLKLVENQIRYGEPIEPPKPSIQPPVSAKTQYNKHKIEHYSTPCPFFSSGIAAWVMWALANPFVVLLIALILKLCGVNIDFIADNTWTVIIANFIFVPMVVGVVNLIINSFEASQIDDRNKFYKEVVQDTYKLEKEKYNAAMKDYNDRLMAYRNNHAQFMETLPSKRKAAQEPTLTNMAKAEVERKEQLKHTSELLTAYYDVNVIHPKYRNLPALCTLYDYLDTGRCYTLEGPGGAYNLYEQEQMMGTIITTLQDIKTDLRQIQENQYTLYNCMTFISDQLEDLKMISAQSVKTLSQIAETSGQIAANTAKAAENTALTNYYSRITAYNTTAEENATRFGVLAGLNKYSVTYKN